MRVVRRTYTFKVTWSDDRLSKDRKHLALHIAKAAGKVAGLEEERDHLGRGYTIHEVFEKAIPDLVILACMYAEGAGADLEDLVKARTVKNMEKRRKRNA